MEIKVHLLKRPGRRNYMMRYLDPLTNKHVSKSAGTPNLRDAQKEAGKWEEEVMSGGYVPTGKWKWGDFRQYYSVNGLAGVADTSAASYETTLNQFEKLTSPQWLADVTTDRVMAFVAKLRERGRREATVAHHLRHLKATCRWAHRHKLLRVLPQFDMPKRAKGSKVMRGRPITTEEFDRMIAKVDTIADCRADPEAWKFYLRGLWTSGLRLSESLGLSWEPKPDAISVDMSGKYPMLRIPSEAEKGGKDRLLPMTPDFAAMLQGVPERLRRGRVFRVDPSRHVTGKVVTAIGKGAGVVVDEDKTGKRKFASAHDLRRAFGQRWSRKVMPTILRELMRHASLATTMAYYVESDAEATARELWGALESGESPQGDHSGDHRGEAAGDARRSVAKNAEKTGV